MRSERAMGRVGDGAMGRVGDEVMGRTKRWGEWVITSDFNWGYGFVLQQSFKTILVINK